MNTINMSIRTDPELKAEAEEILSRLGMTMNGTINMFLMQIVRERAVPLNLSLNPGKNVYADLMHAEAERQAGYEGREANEVLADMRERQRGHRKMRYKVILGSRVDRMLRRHILFLSNVSINQAERFADEFEGIIKQLKSNPFIYPFDGDENLPQEKYRRAIFAKWYKALFRIDGDIVYLDAVCDCREDLSRIIQ